MSMNTTQDCEMVVNTLLDCCRGQNQKVSFESLWEKAIDREYDEDIKNILLTLKTGKLIENETDIEELAHISSIKYVSWHMKFRDSVDPNTDKGDIEFKKMYTRFQQLNHVLKFILAGEGHEYMFYHTFSYIKRRRRC